MQIALKGQTAECVFATLIEFSSVQYSVNSANSVKSNSKSCSAPLPLLLWAADHFRLLVVALTSIGSTSPLLVARSAVVDQPEQNVFMWVFLTVRSVPTL